MLKSVIRYIFLIAFIGLANMASANKLKKAFEALEVHNYFKAKQLFEKRLDKQPVAAGYGLSIIYGRKNNPFYNLDSAYRYINLADTTFTKLNEKEKEKLISYAVNDSSLQNWKDSIALKKYNFTLKNESVQTLEKFIIDYPVGNYTQEIINRRDSVYFFEAVSKNDTNSYKQFIRNYPSSVYSNEAVRLLDKSRFHSVVRLNSILAYHQFATRFPRSKYVKMAQDSVYIKSTAVKSVATFKKFIDSYPSNYNVNKAWRNLYNLYLVDFSLSRVVEFQIDFPNYPFKDELKYDLNLATKQLLPFKLNGKWGFMDTKGTIFIQAKYDYVLNFSEGLAAASLNGKVGYINKSGEVVVPFEYDEGEDFKEGVAVVLNEDYYGLIDRVNSKLLPLEYDFIGELIEQRMVVNKENNYGYADNNGKIVIPLKFHAATNFSKGYAIVKTVHSTYSLINSAGDSILNGNFSNLEFISGTSLIKAKSNGFFGVLNLNGDTIVDFNYDYIGKISGNLVVIAKDGKYGYMNSMGKIVLLPKYNYTKEALLWNEFDQGYAKYLRKEKFGIIDTSGKEVVPAIFENIKEYNPNGLFPVKKRGKWGYSNPKLALKIDYNYEVAEPFIKGKAIVKNDTAYGIISEDTEWLLQPIYSKVEKLDDYYIIRKASLYGLVNDSLQTILEITASNISKFNDEYLLMEVDGNSIYYSLLSNLFIKPEAAYE